MFLLRLSAFGLGEILERDFLGALCSSSIDTSRYEFQVAVEGRNLRTIFATQGIDVGEDQIGFRKIGFMLEGFEGTLLGFVDAA